MQLTARQSESEILLNCVVALGLSLCCAVSAGAQELPESSPEVASGQCRWDSDKPGPLGLGRRFAGIDRECLLCHSSENPGGYSGPLTLTEARVWKESDPHSWAYAVLLSEESQRMGERLGNPENIHRDARCLACHSGFPLHDVELEEGLVTEKFMSVPHNYNLLAWGVSCEACHGASRDGEIEGRQFPGWLEHHRKADWANMPAKKKEEFGYYDIRSPLAKARMCVSCHVGSAEEGRVVTHEMYAAGHPPLPSFELETFLQQMPPHWKTKSDDPEQDNSADKTAKTLRSMAIGAAVTWAEQLRLTAALCQSQAASPAANTTWPELAQFECYACHHELKQAGWRVERKLAVTPGRPLFRGAPSPVFRAFLAVIGDEKDLQQQEREVLKAFSMRPFGMKPAELSPVLLEAADWADNWADKWAKDMDMEEEGKPIDSRKFMLELSSIAAEDVYEYETARQIMWAFQSAWIAMDEDAKSAEVEQSLAKIQQMFLTTLRDARNNPATEAAAKVIPNVQRNMLFINLEEVFPPIANYDAVKFREEFGKIHGLLASDAELPK